MEKEFAIVYLAGGISSRFNGKIKGLVEINGKEILLEYSLNQAIKAGFNKIILIVGDKTVEAYKKHFGASYRGISIYYALQECDYEKRDKPWGTADALCCAAKFIGCPFVVCNADDIYGEESFLILINHLKINKSCATIGYKLGKNLPEKGGGNRAIFTTDKGYVKKLKEIIGLSLENLHEKELSKENLCSMNIFALQPEILRLLSERVDRFKQDNLNERRIECYLPMEISELISSNMVEMKLYRSDIECFGITNPGDELVLREKLRATKEFK